MIWLIVLLVYVVLSLPLAVFLGKMIDLGDDE